MVKTVIKIQCIYLYSLTMDESTTQYIFVTVHISYVCVRHVWYWLYRISPCSWNATTVARSPTWTWIASAIAYGAIKTKTTMWFAVPFYVCSYICYISTYRKCAHPWSWVQHVSVYLKWLSVNHSPSIMYQPVSHLGWNPLWMTDNIHTA